MAPVYGVVILVQPATQSWGWGLVPFWLAMRAYTWLDSLRCVDVYMRGDILTRSSMPYQVVIDISRYRVQ
jgi:hypothetical protein